MRDSRIYLAPEEARCAPVHPCGKTGTCARFLSPIPKGGSVRDFSTSPTTGLAWPPGMCNGYLSPGAAPDVPRERAHKLSLPW